MWQQWAFEQRPPFDHWKDDCGGTGAVKSINSQRNVWLAFKAEIFQGKRQYAPVLSEIFATRQVQYKEWSSVWNHKGAEEWNKSRVDSSSSSLAALCRAVTRPVLILLPVLGLTWLCGVLVHLSAVVAYIFITLNAFQVKTYHVLSFCRCRRGPHRRHRTAQRVNEIRL